ncbi:hypothetical protein LFREDSHE_44970 [Shewanella baltica]
MSQNMTPPTTSSSGAEFHFQALTPDLILDAIESLGVYPETGLLALNSYENRVYQFRSDEGLRYVVKFYRPDRWSDAQIQEEHDYALALAAEDIPIAVPVIIEGHTLHKYQGYRFTLFPSLGGRAFEVDNLEQLELVGRFIGRIHQYAAQTVFAEREPLNPQILGAEPLAWLKQSNLVPNSLRLPFLPSLSKCWLRRMRFGIAKILRPFVCMAIYTQAIFCGRQMVPDSSI